MKLRQATPAKNVFEPIDDDAHGPRPRRPRALLFGAAVSVAVLVAWAAVAEIDQVTRTAGQVIADARTQVVQAPEGGVVTHLHVKEGDTVAAGQLIVTLEKDRAQAAVDESSAKVAALRITLRRLESEVFGSPLVFEADLRAFTDYVRNQTALHTRRQTAFREDIAAIDRVLALAEDELRITSKLLDTNDISRAEVLRLERAVADLLAQRQNRRNKFFQDAQAEMTKVQEDLNTQRELLRDRTTLLRRTELFAPAVGVVNSIRATTVGAVLRPGDAIIELLPTDTTLVVEAKVSPADIAFVNVGQSAFVKLDTYDSAIFGAIEGRVRYISPDVLFEESRAGRISYYRVLVDLTNPEYKGSRAEQMRPRAGLTAQVEIKARSRSVLSYLTRPITRTLENSLGER